MVTSISFTSKATTNFLPKITTDNRKIEPEYNLLVNNLTPTKSFFNCRFFLVFCKSFYKINYVLENDGLVFNLNSNYFGQTLKMK